MLKYWLWLTTRQGLGTRGAYLAVRHFGSPEAAYFADREACFSVPGLRNGNSLLDKDMRLPEKILGQCYEKGIGILTFQDAAYPERLRNIDDPPLVLYYRGSLAALGRLSVSVVGTRTVSTYGLVQADKMGYGLSRCGCTVVSGGARGVDAAAMKGALRGGSPVVGVLGCGVDVAYPSENKSLFDQVTVNGCLISEYPPQTRPRPEFFPVRNRIISGLGLGVLVVEAPERSGALVTANLALEQGRDVFTIPANLDTISCRGNLKLLRDGAIIVRDAWDILQEYVHLYPEQIKRNSCLEIQPETHAQRETAERRLPDEPSVGGDEPGSGTITELPDGLQGDERLLAELLLDGPMYTDAVVEESQLPAGRVLASLTLLEVKGIIRRTGNKRFELVPQVL